MAITKSQSWSNHSNGASNASQTATSGSSVTSGKPCIVVVQYYNTAATVTVTSDKTTGNFTQVGSGVTQTSGGSITSHLFYHTFNASGTCVVTASFSPSIAYCGVGAYEVSGLTTLALDVSGSNKGSSTSPSYTGLTTTQTNTLVIVSYLSDSGGFGGSFTGATVQERSNLSTLFQANILADDINTSSGSQSYSCTQSSGNWIVQAAAFYDSSGGAGRVFGRSGLSGLGGFGPTQFNPTLAKVGVGEKLRRYWQIALPVGA